MLCSFIAQRKMRYFLNFGQVLGASSRPLHYKGIEGPGFVTVDY
jgi:hypothetical protein